DAADQRAQRPGNRGIAGVGHGGGKALGLRLRQGHAGRSHRHIHRGIQGHGGGSGFRGIGHAGGLDGDGLGTGDRGRRGVQTGRGDTANQRAQRPGNGGIAGVGDGGGEALGLRLRQSHGGRRHRHIHRRIQGGGGQRDRYRFEADG